MKLNELMKEILKNIYNKLKNISLEFQTYRLIKDKKYRKISNTLAKISQIEIITPTELLE